MCADKHGFHRDRTAALLSESLGADALVILTDIDGVYVDFNKPTQRKLDTIDAETISRSEEKVRQQRWVEWMLTGAAK